MDVELLELAEKKTVGYHSPDFFLKVLPRKHQLLLLLPLDFNEVDDPDGIADDAKNWTLIPHANHEGGITIYLKDDRDIDNAVPIIRQSLNVSRTNA